MSINVKNPQTLALVAELARRRGVTKVQAITDAVAAQLSSTDEHSLDVDAVLRAIWADQTPGELAAIDARMKALYDDRGLPA